MMMIWNRRRPNVWIRILRVSGIVVAAVGAALGAEMLRRKLGIALPHVLAARNGRTTRVRVSLPTRRRRRISAVASRS